MHGATRRGVAWHGKKYAQRSRGRGARHRREFPSVRKRPDRERDCVTRCEATMRGRRVALRKLRVYSAKIARATIMGKS
jgi:hypothetical protein